MMSFCASTLRYCQVCRVFSFGSCRDLPDILHNLSNLKPKVFCKYLKIQFIPHRKHFVSVTKTSRLMVLRKIIVVYCANYIQHAQTPTHTHTHTHALCLQNAERLNIKSGGTYGYRGTAIAQWLRCCATNWKVAGSIPDRVIGIFH